MNDQIKLPQKFADKGRRIALEVKVFGHTVDEYDRSDLLSIIGMMVDNDRRETEIKADADDFKSLLRGFGCLGLP